MRRPRPQHSLTLNTDEIERGDLQTVTSGRLRYDGRVGGVRDNSVSDAGCMDTPTFRIWPPIALGVPWLAGLLTSAVCADPVRLGPGFRVVGWLMLGFFAVWNGACLAMMARHRTALLPGGSTRVILDRGPFGISRNPLYVGLVLAAAGLALLFGSFWALLSVPVGLGLLWWGAVAPEENYLRGKFGAEYDEYCHRVRRWL